jgi:hypothetical protein
MFAAKGVAQACIVRREARAGMGRLAECLQSGGKSEWARNARQVMGEKGGERRTVGGQIRKRDTLQRESISTE